MDLALVLGGPGKSGAPGDYGDDEDDVDTEAFVSNITEAFPDLEGDQGRIDALKRAIMACYGGM